MCSVLVLGGSLERGGGFTETPSEITQESAITKGDWPFSSFRQVPRDSVSFRSLLYRWGRRMERVSLVGRNSEYAFVGAAFGDYQSRIREIVRIPP